jgi:hypothetical protein
MKIHLSELDEKRFGVVTAKMNMEANDELDTAVVWCKAHKVQFLITRIATDQIDIAQRLEHTGFYLTDTLVYFRNKTIKLSTFKLPSGYKQSTPWQNRPLVGTAVTTMLIPNWTQRIVTSFILPGQPIPAQTNLWLMLLF